jgi:hypothetical protein
MHRFGRSAVALLGGIALQSCVVTHDHPTGAIEQHYYASGSWSVTATAAFACCDSLGHKYDIWYPTPLGNNGFKHPILTWANGTNAVTSQYNYLLTHLASWGFVVIATEDKATGPGQTVLDAANYLVARNGDPASMFFHKLDVSNIGALGHSQGAGGAINAMIKSMGSIKTSLPIELPSHAWCTGNCIDTSTLGAGSIFFVDGSLDPISPPTQPPGTSGLQSIAAFYGATPAAIPKVKGTLIGPSHNDVTGQPDCASAVPPCLVGAYGYIGYPTAWLMYRLQNDNYAHGAFVAGSGEMFSQPLNWQDVASNIP